MVVIVVVVVVVVVFYKLWKQVSKHLCVVCEIYVGMEFLLSRLDLGKQIPIKDKIAQCQESVQG